VYSTGSNLGQPLHPHRPLQYGAIVAAAAADPSNDCGENFSDNCCHHYL